MKFLIIRFSPFGEIVLASPLLRCLRKVFPEAVIHFLTDDACRAAIEFNPHINKLHVFAHSQELMIEELKTEEYDRIIDLQQDTNSIAVSKALGIRPLLAGSNNFWKNIFSSLKKGNLVDQYFNAVRSLGVVKDGDGLDYFISDQEETKKNDVPGSHYAGYITCAIGGNNNKKKWPVARWKEFCSQLDHPIILIGGKEDVSKGKEIASVDDIKVYNACGKFSLNEMADLVRKSKSLVSNETDYIQIAAAYNRPVVLISEKKTTAYPYYGNKFLIGQQQRPYDIFQSKHIENIAVIDLVNAVKKWL